MSIRNRIDSFFQPNSTEQKLSMNGELLGTGIGEGRVYRHVDGYAIKIFDGSDFKDKPEKVRKHIEKILALHQAMLEAGLPTIPEMKYDETRNALVMTDMTYGDKVVVFSSPDFSAKMFKGQYREGKFANLDMEKNKFILRNAPALSRYLAEVYVRTVDAGCEIKRTHEGKAKTDLFFIGINNQSHDGEIILADLASVDFTNDRKKIIEVNYESFSRLIHKINKLVTSDSQLSTEALDMAHQNVNPNKVVE